MKLITFALLIVLASCTNPDKTKEVLKAEGYTNIKTTGYAMWMCAEGDAYATGFEATSKAGKRVKGAVCGGFGKGYTIRFD